MTAPLEALKVGALLFLAAIVQVSILSSVDVIGGRPDLVLLTLPVYAVVRRVVRPLDRSERAQEVHLLV